MARFLSPARFLALAVLCSFSRGAQAQDQRRPLPDFDINLDLAPELRFTAIVQHFNASIHSFTDKLITHNLPVKALLYGLVGKRGPETEELQGEIRGIAKLTGLPEYIIHAVQMLYELQTVMVPIWNITLPWRGPGCTGIVALNKADGKVYHARNLDMSPDKLIQELMYTGIFKKAGREVFRAEMFAAVSFVVTGMKKGPNGFAMETNTRYLDHWGGNKEMLTNLLSERRLLNTWSARKILETAVDYEAAVEAFSSVKLVATQYVILSGVKKGTILARNPDGLAYQLTLGQPNYHCRDDYIIVTNMDYWYHDIREWFDPTCRKGIGHSRRISAQKILNNSAALTPEVLFSTIDNVDVRATDTIYQVIMSVETGLFNASLPGLALHNTDPVKVANVALLSGSESGHSFACSQCTEDVSTLQVDKKSLLQKCNGKYCVDIQGHFSTAKCGSKFGQIVSESELYRACLRALCGDECSAGIVV